MPTIQELIDELTPIVVKVGLELDELKLSKAGKYRVLEVALDGDAVDLDQVANASREISAYLDESDLMGAQPYTLEVTTRGVDRPLTKEIHWQRNIGRLVEVVIAEKKHVGRIKGISGSNVEIDVNGETKQFELNQISQALIQVEFSKRESSEQD